MGERWKVSPEGVYELVDEATGHVLAVQKLKERDRSGALRKGGPGRGRKTKDGGDTHHWVVDAAGRKIWVPKGTNPDNLPRIVYPYCETTADLILEKISEGATISDIGKLEGFPPSHIIHKWGRRYPEFKAGMKEARLARAEVYADEVKKIADLAEEDSSKAARVKMDAHMWLAEVNDRVTYGKSTKIMGDLDSPIGFIIQTGVPEAPALPVESRRIESEEVE